jgi:hypothetical protein
LPIYPVEAVLIAGGLIAASNALAQRRLSIFHALPLPIFVAIIELVALVRLQPLWKDDTRDHAALLRDVLALTNRDDYILDCKGETVFRQRALHLVLEKITQHAIEQGLLIDDAPQRCIATHTCVAVTIIEERFSAGTLHFIEENYLPVTKNLRVAGVALKPSAEDATRSEFDVVIPASYKLISREGNVSASLDGAPYEGARFLTPGRHVFQSRAPLENVVLLWAQAVDRRFTPFGHL